MFACLFFALFTVAFSTSCLSGYNGVENPYPSPDPIAPDVFNVSFGTSNMVNGEKIKIQVTRAWSPLGVDRFYALVSDRYYTCAGFFRVVPDFVVQFGIAADPAETAKWDTPIPDDPVVKSNLKWTVSFATAGPDTRTTQIFINYVDNVSLDDQGFSPFGEVWSGFDTALGIVNPTPGDSNGVNQEIYTLKGNDWLLNKYPDTTLISSTELYV